MDVGAWLRGLGLRRYEQAFRENDIDATVLPELTAEDLIDLGVASIGHRRKLLAAIAALRDDTSPAQNAPAEHQSTVVPEAERRQLTVMFADLVGSTALSAQLDPEELREVLHAYQDAAAGAIARFEGHVAKFMGDGVLAYFGWPKAHEDDAERAVRAALALLDGVGRLRTPMGEPLAARAGIATGLVVVGALLGEGAAREETVIGDTPNLAARLQVIAAPGSVIVAEGTRRLLGTAFELEPLEPRPLKGLGEAVPAFRVLAERPVRSRFEARQRGAVLPLVGREPELTLLLARWQLARTGQGQAMLLSGEPGIGKSRLAEALADTLVGEPHVAIRYQCSPQHSGTPLWPIAEQLGRMAGFAPDDDAAACLGKLEALFQPGTGDATKTAALLAPLLGIEPAEHDPSLEGLTPRQRRAHALTALVNHLVGLAAEQPVLILFEDVHWIDPTSLELVEYLLGCIGSSRILVLLTSRPDEQPRLSHNPRLTRLALNRLSREASAAIIREVGRGKPLPPDLEEAITRRTDGVPLFVEELTRAVLEAGLLREDRERYVLDSPVPPLAIPDTLHSSLLARLDRLAPAKEVAQVGAAIGREFSHELLAAVAPLPQDQLARALDELVAAELVFRRGAFPDVVYAFKHALVQDAAYDTLLKSRRQQLHARIARVLEERFPEQIEMRPELLARHCTEAGLTERAIEYWYRAGQRAIARSALAEAVAQLTEGLKVLRSLPEDLERDRRELNLQTALAIALSPFKGQAAPETGWAYTRARELAQSVGDTEQLLPVLYGQWVHHVARAELHQACQVGDEMLRLSREQRDIAAQVVAHRHFGTNLLALGRFGLARTHLEQAVALYDPERHRSLGIRYVQNPGPTAPAWLAWTLLALGYPEQARARHHEAIAKARHLGHPNTLAQVLFCGCMFSQLLGDRQEVEQQAETLAPLSAEQGFPFWSAMATILRGWAQAEVGGADRAIVQMNSGLAAYRAISAKLWTPYFLCLLAMPHVKTGQAVTGLGLLREALEMLEATDERWCEPELHRCRGELLLCSSSLDKVEAEASFLRAVAVARAQDAKLWELRAATSLARLWQDHGRCVEAHDLLAPVYGWFSEGFDTPDLREARALLDELASAPSGSRARPQYHSAAPVNNPG